MIEVVYVKTMCLAFFGQCTGDKRLATLSYSCKLILLSQSKGFSGIFLVVMSAQSYRYNIPFSYQVSPSAFVPALLTRTLNQPFSLPSYQVNRAQSLCQL